LTNIVMAFPTLAVGPKHLYITFSAVLTSGYTRLRSRPDPKCTRSCLHVPGDVARCRCWSPLCGSLAFLEGKSCPKDVPLAAKIQSTIIEHRQLLLFMHYWLTGLVETHPAASISDGNSTNRIGRAQRGLHSRCGNCRHCTRLHMLFGMAMLRTSFVDPCPG
jgi:hypothetical protein